MKRYFFLLPAILLVACSDKKSPEIFQGELELGAPVRTTIQDQITEWYRLQEEERRLNEQRRPPADQPTEEGDQALNPPEEGAAPLPAERPGDEGVVGEGDRAPAEEEVSPAEEGVEAEPLGEEEREPVEDGGIVEEVSEREEEETPGTETDDRPVYSAEATPPPALRTAPPVECEATRGLIRDGGRCVCNQEAGFYTPPAGYAQEDSGGKRCLRKVSQANLTLYVGSIADAGIGNVYQREKVLFQICKEPPLLPMVDTRCFISKLHPSVDLARHTHPVIQFGRDQVNAHGDRVSSSSLRIGAKRIEQLYFPDDVQFLMLRPNPADPNTDELFLAGLKLEIETGESAPPVVVYDNHLLHRWIGKDGSDFYLSPISIHGDDAWFVYIETPGHAYEGTDCGVSLKIPLASQGLHSSSTQWIKSPQYHSDAIPTLNLNGLLLNVSLNYSDYDDFGHDQDPGIIFAGEGASGAKTTYAFTIYDGRYRMQDKYQLKTNCGDAWKPHIVKVAHIMPDYGGFLGNGTCVKDTRTVDRWLSTDTDEGEPTWPSPASPYRLLRVGNCRNISELQLQEDRWDLPILQH